MKKMLWLSTMFYASLLLSGCNKLTSYTITEQEVNQYLNKYNEFEKNVEIPGLLEAHITLNNLTSQIAREEPNTVTLTGHGIIKTDSLLGVHDCNLQVSLKAQPQYEAKQGAIYLKEMAITDYRVKPENMSSAMKAIAPYLNKTLKNYFNQNPVYTLGASDNKKELMVKKQALSMEIKPGELIISLQ